MFTHRVKLHTSSELHSNDSTLDTGWTKQKELGIIYANILWYPRIPSISVRRSSLHRSPCPSISFSVTLRKRNPRVQGGTSECRRGQGSDWVRTSPENSLEKVRVLVEHRDSREHRGTQRKGRFGVPMTGILSEDPPRSGDLVWRIDEEERDLGTARSGTLS